MNRFLLDTSVLSTFAPDRPPVAPELREWIVEQGGLGTLFTSAIVIEELQKGLSRLRRLGSSNTADRLERWLADILQQFGERVLPVDGRVARAAGELEDQAIANGRNPGLADVLIAATVKAHELSVATANARHFAAFNVNQFDPATDSLPRLPG